MILNADWDHPDIFANLDAVIATFVAWARPVLARGYVVINVADEGGASISQALRHDASEAERAHILTLRHDPRLGAEGNRAAARHDLVGICGCAYY